MAEIRVNIEDPAAAERIARAIERAGCLDMIECIAEQYRDRIKDAFARHCPDRAYTGSPLDVDTLMAYLEVKLSQATPPRRRSSDHEGGPDVPSL